MPEPTYVVIEEANEKIRRFAECRKAYWSEDDALVSAVSAKYPAEWHAFMEVVIREMTGGR